MAEQKQKQYLEKHHMADVVNDMLGAVLAAQPKEPMTFLLDHFKKLGGGLAGVTKKMEAEGLSQACIKAFAQAYSELKSGKTGMIPESSISPASGLPELTSLAVGDSVPADILDKTIVLKLNGGLGTSMGLEKAKSLLEVKDGLTFLDFVALQIKQLRAERKCPKLSFMLMNSFSTTEDTKAFFKAKYPEYYEEWEKIELVQNKVPKITQEGLDAVTWTKDPEKEWCPPGHGDLYAALYGSGKLQQLLDEGREYMFVSNSDNLGATLNIELLGWFANTDVDFCMEVCERTESDKKGGHLCVDNATGQLQLRESAQCAKADEAEFQNVSKHRYFNTNNLWIKLSALKAVMEKNGGVMPLPLIKNSKTVDPTDPSSTPVFQLETAMGAAIASFPKAQAVVVPRERFAPVKTCNDLLALRSDVYEGNEQTGYQVRLIDSRAGKGPVVNLDTSLYKMVPGLEKLTQGTKAIPSMASCASLTLKGPWKFSPGVVFQGNVKLENTGSAEKVLPSGTYADQTL